MKKYCLFVVTIFLLFSFLSSAWGEFYQWTDKNGNVVFSDTPPPGGNAKKKLKDDGVYTSAPRDGGAEPENRKETGSITPSRDGEREAKRNKRIRDVNVVLYMTNWCGYCKKAREYIKSLGASLTEYNIDEDRNKKEEMIKKSGSTSIPVIDVDGTIIRGYNPSLIKQAIETKANL